MIERIIETERVQLRFYMERTLGGALRQLVFKGLRDDKTPEECVVIA